MSLFLSVVTLLSLVLFFGTGLLVARARGIYGIHAPATTGHPDFERTYRAQMNTLEQLVLFLPSLWLAGAWFDARIAGFVGVAWLVGRAWYVAGYMQAAEKRSRGFLVGALALFGLWGLAGWGMVKAFLAA